MKSFFCKLSKKLNIKYERKTLWHNLVLLLALLLCIIVCLSATGNAGANMSYPLSKTNVQFEQYALQFHAFLNDSIPLEAAPPAKLAELDNPYDPYERDAAGLYYFTDDDESKYLWDVAYYNGQYFSYFGISPILTVYYPVYFLTGLIPGTNLVCLILAIAAIVFMGLAYREAVIRFAPNANLWLMAIGLIGFIWASGVFVGLSYSDNYYIAVLSAMEWSMASIFFGFRAMRARRTLSRSLLLAACAVSLTLTVWSRPSVAVMCLVLVPVFLEFALKTRKNNLKEQLIPIGAFITVLSLGAAAVMWYNNIRFDSPFEFGAVYQLTVSDISQNTFSLSMLIPAFGVYLFQPPSYIDKFPHIGTSLWNDFGISDRYIYVARTVGSVFFALPVGVLSPSVYSKKKENTARTATYILLILLVLFTAFSDFCLGGVNMRYLFDFLPLVSMFGAIAIINTESTKEGGAKAIPSILLILACVAAVLMTYGIIKCNLNDAIFGVSLI